MEINLCSMCAEQTNIDEKILTIAKESLKHKNRRKVVFKSAASMKFKTWQGRLLCC